MLLKCILLFILFEVQVQSDVVFLHTHLFYWGIVALQCCDGFGNEVSQLRYTHIPPNVCLPPPHPTPLGHLRARSWAPWARQQLSATCLFYT